jgi:hypothetical protein
MNIQEEIDRRNKEFAAADAPGKRRLLAQDVLNLMDAGIFYANHGAFWGFTQIHRILHPNDSVQEKILDGSITSCDCCALGALFLSCTLYNNQFTYGEKSSLAALGHNITRGDGFKNKFEQVFTVRNLIQIELAFEQGKGYFDCDDRGDYEWKMDAISFGKRYDNPESRMIAIMENIVKHGEFRP